MTDTASTGNDQMKAASSRPLPEKRQHNIVAAIDKHSGEDTARKNAGHSATTQVAPAKTGISWVAVFDRLLSEIKVRHDSPKTLKAYRSWARQFQC